MIGSRVKESNGGYLDELPLRFRSRGRRRIDGHGSQRTQTRNRYNVRFFRGVSDYIGRGREATGFEFGCETTYCPFKNYFLYYPLLSSAWCHVSDSYHLVAWSVRHRRRRWPSSFGSRGKRTIPPSFTPSRFRGSHTSRSVKSLCMFTRLTHTIETHVLFYEVR